MKIRRRPPGAALPLVLSLVLLAGCASGGARTPAESVTRLEAERTKNPNSAAALRALGIAYFQAERFPEARDVLAAAEQALPNDGVTALYRGLTAEALNDLTGARDHYSRYLTLGTSAKTKKQIRDRLATVARRELELTAKAAVAQEAQLSSQPGAPNTIAVPPLKFSGSDTSLIPLERGVAELLITDLARSKQLTLLERERIQVLLDEVGRSQGDRVDDATKVRAGKMLQAGRLIQGSITQVGTSITLTTAAVSVQTAQVSPVATGDDQLEQLFDLEKKVVFDLFDRLGVTLTSEERNQVQAARPTRNLRAFLAYSRGLMADDRGDFFEAARLFNDARSLDPGFGGAGIKAAGATAAAQGTQVSSATVQASTSGSEGAVVKAAAGGSMEVQTGSAQAAANDVNVSQNATSAGGGQTQTGGGTTGATSGGTPPPTTPPPPTVPTGPLPQVTGTITFVIRSPEL